MLLNGAELHMCSTDSCASLFNATLSGFSGNTPAWLCLPQFVVSDTNRENLMITVVTVGDGRPGGILNIQQGLEIS